MSETTEFWAGEFGDEYTKRNDAVGPRRSDFWDKFFVKFGSEIASALEIGCNRGHNLSALQNRGIKTACGIDVNDSAIEYARTMGLVVDKCEATKLLDYAMLNSFDLVFTAGVLIHIPPNDLMHVMEEIASVSRCYVLAVEYEDTRETDVNYRGSLGRLWRRPYGHIYTRLGLRLVQKWAAPEFDNSTAWLFRKD
jgi:pseudaminic acid biosynthesis-associated methylase